MNIWKAHYQKMNEQFNRLPAGLLILSKEGIILSMNRTLLELLAHGEDQVVGQHINVILAPSAKAFTQLYFFPLILGKQKVEEMYLALLDKHGKEVPVLLNATLDQQSEDQVITCMMIAMKNRNEYENQLILAKRFAEDGFDEISQMNAKLEHTLEVLEKKEQQLLKVNRQNERFKVNIQNELTLAKKVQAKSLPLETSHDRIETASYYLASGELSGDIYGFYQINDHQYGVIILDVMGQGISAALITMSLQSLFQMLINKGATTDVVMKELDDHLHTLFKNNQDLWHYSTGICLMIDTKKQTIECTNAGHPPAIFQTSTGEQVELGATSPPIGTFEGMSFKVETMTYDEGSRILLYTDGISEALPPNRLHAILRENSSESLSDGRDRILQSIQDNGEKQVKEDDQCFIFIGLQ